MGKKAKAPAQPDLVAANAAQVAANKGAAYDVRDQNQYSQVTPYARNDWQVNPATGKMENVTSLSPEQQALYMGNNALAQKMSGGASGALDSFMQQYWPGAGGGAAGGGGGGGAGSSSGGMVPNFGPSTASGSFSGSSSTQRSGIPGGIYSADKATGVGGVGGGIQGDLDYSKLTAMPTTDPAVARQQAQDALYGMQSQYLDPQWKASQAALSTKLSNQGLVPGTEAYNRAMQVENDAQQKAYSDARQSAIAGGGAEAERAQQMALALRNQGITEAGNLGAFHNAAQGQRANQILNDVTTQRNLEGTKYSSDAAANASMQNAALANQLGQRNESFNELLKMGQFGQSGQVNPNFTTSQGNLGTYGTGDLVGAESKQYNNAVAAQQTKNSGGIMGMIPGALGLAGTYFGGPLLGAAGSALAGKLFGPSAPAAPGGADYFGH